MWLVLNKKLESELILAGQISFPVHLQRAENVILYEIQAQESETTRFLCDPVY